MAFRQATEAANKKKTTKAQTVSGQKQSKAAPAKRKKKTGAIIAAIVSVVLLIGIGTGVWFYLNATKDDGLIYSNVYTAGINLGGMTPEQAKSAIRRVTDTTYTQQALTVKLPDTTLVFRPEDTGARLDVDRLVDAAYAYGREGSRWQRTQAKAAASLTSYTLQLLDYLTLDTGYISDVLQQQADAALSHLTQTTVSVTGEVPELNRTLAEAESDDSVVHMRMTITLGTPEQSLDTAVLYDAILKAYADNDFTTIAAAYQVTQPDALDLEALFEQYCVEPVDAILDEETYSVTPEVLGYGFDPEELQAQLEEAEPGQELVISFGFIEPAITMESLEDYMFQDVLASYSSNHVYNPPRTNNLVLACKAIDGTILRPGEEFSFNKTVGERTAEKGYQAAGVYSGGATVNELGGGVCQVASTIYYCALYADLEITQRSEHMFMVDYVPPGMDATVYWGSLDFRFRNNTDYPIRIDASCHDGAVHITLNGTDDRDYYVKMTYDTVAYQPSSVKYKVYAPGNAEGYYDGQVIQTAYDGYTIKTYRNKYSKATNELISSELEATSVFNRRDRLICIIGDPSAPTDESGRPIETTAPPTDPPVTDPPATEPPATEAPATDPPATEAPTETSTGE